MNKKGFVVSSIIYSILILFVLLIASILLLLGSRKLAFDRLKKDVANDLNGDISFTDERGTLSYVLAKQYNDYDPSIAKWYGLNKDDNGYYYSGTNAVVTNNYVWFEGHLWRVLSINNDNSITMITQQPLTSIQPASAVWTTQATYEASYVNKWLNEVFLASISDQSKILDNVYNVGIYTNVSEIKTTQKVGLLDNAQYTKAGTANSFLNIKDSFWLGNRYDTSRIRYVNDSGSVGSYNPLDSYGAAFGIRPVIKISNLNDIVGDGTLNNPYREKSTSSNTNNVKVGEYISVPTSSNECGADNYCLFRVVSKDSDSVKVVLNGLLATTSAFGSPTLYTSNNTIDTNLKEFANTIDNQYRYTGNKVFNIGRYAPGANYTAVTSTIYQGNVGLPVIGEIFSGNDIDVDTSAKIFVNVNTIENATLTSYFFPMNAPSDSNVYYVSYSGMLVIDVPSSTRLGVRPVMFLKQGLAFTGGDGTAERPYTLD